ncbi:hypothetical protein ILYODFUR_004445 [Ilyodon furcidens]|uniref:Uncharacterized protein n=1 Tax=Ilyodon furcidens TaxID=33524 RepID=A0ABV0THS4_9TELE
MARIRRSEEDEEEEEGASNITVLPVCSTEEAALLCFISLLHTEQLSSGDFSPSSSRPREQTGSHPPHHSSFQKQNISSDVWSLTQKPETVSGSCICFENIRVQTQIEL